MSIEGFIDVPLGGSTSWDWLMTAPVISEPRMRTEIQIARNFKETRNRVIAEPLRRFRLPEAIREFEHVNNLYKHWLIMNGPWRVWPFRDPWDFASVDLEQVNVTPTTSLLDQALGTGDRSTTQFQMKKVYSLDGQTITRNIYLPDTDTIELAVNCVDPASAPVGDGGPYTATVSREGGIVTFAPAPQSGVTLTWGGLFDALVRYEDDNTYAAIVESFMVGKASDLVLLEVPPC